MKKTPKAVRAWAAYGESAGIYSPGNIMTLCVYEKLQHGLSDGFQEHELIEILITPLKKKGKVRR